MRKPRREKRTERIKTIFRLMVRGQWTPAVRTELREKWRASKECESKREWDTCCQAARAAVQAEIELDPPTKALLLAGVQETLASVVSVMGTARQEAKDVKLPIKKDGDNAVSETFMKARLLDCASRAGQAALGYWQLLLSNTTKVDDLPDVPPAELLDMLSERMRRKGGGGE